MSLGSIVINELIVPIDTIEMVEGKIRFRGRLLGPGQFELLGDSRVHGSDGVQVCTTRCTQGTVILDDHQDCAVTLDVSIARMAR